MNKQPSWFHRISEIVEQLALVEEDLLDRQACELLFDLRRAATVDMMRRMGAKQFGKSLVIGRATLIARLQELRDSPDWEWATARRKRVAVAIASAKSAAGLNRVIIAPVTRERSVDELPGVSVTPEALIIRHDGPEDLLRRLVLVVQAIAANPTVLEERASR